MKLYEIPELIRKSLEAVEVDEETGELLNVEQVVLTGEEAQKKILGALAFVKELDADKKMLAEQIANLQKRKKSYERKIEFIKKLCLDGMKSMDLKSLKDAQITGSVRSTERVDVVDLDSLPADFVRIVKEADKTAIKEAIKAGELVAGAELVKSESVSIR